jgi:hypothetical protein
MKRLERPEKRQLQSIISDIRDGKFAIPTFQREFDWGAKDILELIRSIFEDYYIGTLLFWKVSSENINSLKYEPVYGFEGKFSPEYFVLDGQQRLSALYYALCAPMKNFPHRKNKCFFFIDTQKMLNAEFDKAFFYEWESKRVIELLNNKDQQFENHTFPLGVLGNKDIYLWTKWIDEYRDYWVNKGKKEFKEIGDNLYNNFKDILQDYEISFIELDKSLEMSKVCDIFTRINTRGIELSIFDILNAAFLPKGIELKEDWRKIDLFSPIKKLEEEKMKVYLLQTISILKQSYCSPKYLYYLVPGSKRKIKSNGQIIEDVLIPTKKDFEDMWKLSVQNVELTIRKITNPREFGAIKPKFIPYISIIPAFTAIDFVSKNPSQGDMSNKNNKIAKWYWASIFTNNYSSSVESQATSDFLIMKKWFEDESAVPEVIDQAINDIKNMELKKETSQSSAIYNAIFNLMTINGARDLITFDLPEYSELDDHHIIPQNSLLGKRLGNKVNTILNRIPISDDTNRKVFGVKLPNEYLKGIIECAKDKKKVYEMLESHFISESIVKILLRNPFDIKDFEEFTIEREKLIKDRMLKKLGLLKEEKEEEKKE